MVKTLECGCTLDTDHVATDHNDKGNPYHAKLKADPKAEKAEVNEFEAEAKKQEDAAQDEPEDKPKKKHW